jgi:hypothetical protein
MRIQIQDREYWRKICEQKIASVEAIRAAEDKAYEMRWRKRFWPFKDRPESAKPEPYWFDYPSIAGWGTLNTAKALLKAINDDKTGEIFLDAKEYDYLK